MYEPNPEIFDSKLVEQVVTHTVYDAFRSRRTLTSSDANLLLIKIITSLYYAGYKPFLCGILGLTIEDYARLTNLGALTELVLETDMSFVYLNVFVASYFMPRLLIDEL